MRGEDDDVETDDGSLSDDSAYADSMEGLFSIDIDVFDYETPLCREFKEFYYLL